MSSGTPCEWSGTVSRSGQLVAAMRRRRSSRACSGTSTWKGRTSIPVSTVVLIDDLLGGGRWSAGDGTVDGGRGLRHVDGGGQEPSRRCLVRGRDEDPDAVQLQLQL